ncbi:hypothetical protein [Streptomyces sp. NPDC091649]|uniref:hypothetical protein n=1 Tax=Streptomyces sp. NPDC091649 TaxID=3366004 RepID=UPI003807EC9C
MAEHDTNAPPLFEIGALLSAPAAGPAFMDLELLREAGHLYYPGCLSLARKQTAAASLASWERPADMRVRLPGRRWKAWEDRVLPAHDDAGAAAAELGRSAASCSVRLWRLKTGEVRHPEDTPPGA